MSRYKEDVRPDLTSPTRSSKPMLEEDVYIEVPAMFADENQNGKES
jgi:hypothetical protein